MNKKRIAIRKVSKFAKSESRFDLFKKELGIVGYMNYELIQDNICIQSWNTSKGVILVQLYANGNGFQVFKPENTISKLLKACLMIARHKKILCANLSIEENNLLQEAIKEATE